MTTFTNMDSNNSASSHPWGYLIKEDKTAAPMLEQLCLGLARIIRNFDPSSEYELTPQKLAHFYRSLGGDYDSLFIKTSDSALSFLYRTLGCYHSLQPTHTPYETPSIPCLTPGGFARWLTIQILLCPSEHVPFMQRAVEVYNVPKPGGGNFPRYIPDEALPSRPDEAMERWHKMVTSQMNQDHYVRRLKNSPYHSPYPEGHDNSAGYFGTIPTIKKSRRSPRRPSEEGRQSKITDDYRRRSSVPDLPSPREGYTTAHDKDALRKARSHSGNRPTSDSRPRSSTATAAMVKSPTICHHKSKSMSAQRSGSNTPLEALPRNQNKLYRQDRNRSSPSTPSSGDESSSGDSHQGRRIRSREEDKKSSLWPPFFLQSSKRRHSTDAASRKRDDRSPKREETSRSRKSQYPEPPMRSSQGVRFKPDVFNNNESGNFTSDGSGSGFVSPQPQYRYPEPSHPRFSNIPENHRNAFSRDSSLGRTAELPFRSPGMPMRVNTVTGVNGRSFPNPEPASAGAGRERGGRVRSSVAAMV